MSEEWSIDHFVTRKSKEKALVLELLMIDGSLPSGFNPLLKSKFR